MKYIKYIDTKIGRIGIIEENGQIIKVAIEQEMKKDELVKKDTQLLRKAAKQLEEYFAGKRRKFDLPLKQEGTEFRQKVWKALQEIPYGETRSYKQVAQMIGNPKAARAVGMANNKNHIPIIIPCHRVIGSNGKLVGYALGLEIKQELLELEKATKEE